MDHSQCDLEVSKINTIGNFKMNMNIGNCTFIQFYQCQKKTLTKPAHEILSLRATNEFLKRFYS